MADGVERPIVDRWTRLEQLVPPYPPGLFDRVSEVGALPAHPLVVDLGAGTGRASLPMAGRGWRVIAVDTDQDALAGLSSRARALGCEVRAVKAAAEATGLDAATADLVTAAQSFHWFETDATLAEIARISRDGGVVALVWTMRVTDSSTPTAAHRELLTRYGVDRALFMEAQTAADHAGSALRAAKTHHEVQRHDITHEWTLSTDEWMELATMPRFFTSLDTSSQERFRTELAELLEAYADPATKAVTEINQTTCWTARRSKR